MRQLLVAALVVAAFGSSTAEAQRRPARDVFYVTASEANIRSGPTTNAPIIGRFSYCDAVPVVRQMPGTSWYVVRVGGRQGYMSSTVIGPLPPPGCGRGRRN